MIASLKKMASAVPVASVMDAFTQYLHGSYENCYNKVTHGEGKGQAISKVILMRKSSSTMNPQKYEQINFNLYNWDQNTNKIHENLIEELTSCHL
ncbi:hypothetical protein L1887_35896 [Cichorium endivia]|nr:hypothetical protein L1887_35896 [Cichorium endivia]